MYTDATVAINLYNSNNAFWFMLSCMFIVTPFLLVWVASLRYAQKFMSYYLSKFEIENSKSNFKLISFVANTLLILYIFPPVQLVCTCTLQCTMYSLRF